jgi:GSH-dependent disulfide-bond oxidoreductase
MTGQLVHFIRFAPKGNDYAVSRYTRQMLITYKVLEARPGSSKYIGGAEYGIADIATFPWARATDMFIPGFKACHPHIARWLDDVGARPAVVKALAATDAVRGKVSAFDKVSGRGKFAAA